jgi:heat shock protein HtpX
MATLYTQKDKNITKTWLLMTAFFLIVIALGWFFSYYYQNPNILIIFAIFSIVMNITSYWFSDKIVVALAGAKPVEKAQAPDLYNIVENLSITAGLPLPKIYVINDPSPNAFATGRNPEHAAVAVTTGLLQIMNKSELEGVLAHELSHVGNRDMLVSTVAVVLAGFVSIVADIFLRSQMFGFRRRDDGEGNAGGMLMIVGFIFAILAPIFSMLIQLAISRKREYLADASGALLTRYPEGLASALKKIGEYGRPMQRQSSAIAHLYIANPQGSGKWKKAVGTLFATHPPIEDRIKALLGK